MQSKSIDPDWAWATWEPESGQWNRRWAAHLHRRAGFGAASQQLDAAVAMSPAEAVAACCRATESKQLEQEFDSLVRSVVSSGDARDLAAAWTYRLLKTQAPLREKLALFWHGHFATGAEKVEDVKLMQRQNELFRTHAMGDFAAMLQSVSKDPAMLIYLDSATNRKAHPNENYAREVMELFCLGEGNYSERDVLELARCFTGWEIRRGKYRFNRYQHDFAAKSIFGKQGKFSGEEGVALVLQHASGPEFIASKLVTYFVMDELQPSRELVAPLARQIREDQWNLAKVVQRILSSRIFFSEHAFAAKVKSPHDFIIGMLRSLEGSTNTKKLARGCADIGQGLFYPPNVKGWDGGRAWINSSTLLGRANLVREVLDDANTRFGAGSLSELLDRQELNQPEEVVSWMCELIVAPEIPKEVIAKLCETVEDGEGSREDRLRRTLYMICSLPECQLA